MRDCHLKMYFGNRGLYEIVNPLPAVSEMLHVVGPWVATPLAITQPRGGPTSCPRPLHAVESEVSENPLLLYLFLNRVQFQTEF